MSTECSSINLEIIGERSEVLKRDCKSCFPSSTNLLRSFGSVSISKRMDLMLGIFILTLVGESTGEGCAEGVLVDLAESSEVDASF